MRKTNYEAELKRKDEIIRTLAEMSVQMISLQSRSELARYVAEQVRQLFLAERVSLFYLSPRENKFEQVCSVGYSSQHEFLNRDQVVSQLAQECLQDDTHRFIADPLEELDLEKEPAVKPVKLSWLFLPYRDADQGAGVIHLERLEEKGTFSQDDLNLLTLISAETASSVRNIQLFRDLHTQIKNMHTAQEIGNLVVSTLDLDTVLKLIVRGIRGVTGAEACSIMLWDETNEYLLIRASEGIPDEVVRRARVRRGENIAGYVALEGRPLLVKNLDQDNRFKRTAGSRYSSNSVLSVPLKAKGKVLGVININQLSSPRVFDEDDQNLLMLFANQAAIALENARLYCEVERLATTDGLTDLPNHRSFWERLDRELARAERFMQDLSVLIIDVDFFKSVNDEYGHLVGDEVLKAIGQTLLQMIRRMDFVARYGGEEFAVIMPQTRKPEAARIAERLRERIEQGRWLSEHPDRQITISIGVAGYPDDATRPNDLIDLADQALFRAKSSGRNCVLTHEEVSKP